MLIPSSHPIAALTLFFLAASIPVASAADVELDLESIIVVAPVLDEDGTAVGESMLGEMSLNGQVDTLLENGTRLRLRTTLRAQSDHPQRPGGVAFFALPGGGPTGGFSGVGSGDPLDRGALRTRLETAYLQVDGGYGEVRIGKDRGVAARFFEGAPETLTHARLDSSLLDVTGLSVLRTRHDLTGPSLKLSYATPRLLGLRAGVSLTPEASADGLDRRIGLAPEDLNRAIEVALNGSRSLRDRDLKLEGTLAWSRGQLDGRNSGRATHRDAVETWSAGLRLTQGEWTTGLSWLNSDDGQVSGDYTAWSAGLGRRVGRIDLSLNYGEADLSNPRPKSRTWRIGGRYTLSENAGIGLSLIEDKLAGPDIYAKSSGIVVEITLSTQIFDLSEN